MEKSSSMKLKDYIEKNRMSVSELSRVSGVPVTTLWRYAQGQKRNIKPSVALAISEATNGEVRLLDLLFPDEDIEVIVTRRKNEKE
jgi:transcriptional regulator with XRE-family HTH domain